LGRFFVDRLFNVNYHGKMTVDATIKVELTQQQKQKIALEYLRDKYRIPARSYIEEQSGWIVVDEIYCTTHTFTETKAIREASDEDRLLFEILEDY